MIDPILELDTIESSYPRLFKALRDVGWHPMRQIELPAESPYFAPNDYARAFLRCFGGIRLEHRIERPSRRASTKQLTLGIDERFERIDPGLSALCVQQVAGDHGVYPIFDSGEKIGFCLETDKTLMIGEVFTAYAWAANPFQMVEWELCEDNSAGLAMHDLARDRRPSHFYYAD